eukprot:Nk52_evm1s621 gene=Nk52_evmTU1s621
MVHLPKHTSSSSSNTNTTTSCNHSKISPNIVDHKNGLSKQFDSISGLGFLCNGSSSSSSSINSVGGGETVQKRVESCCKAKNSIRVNGLKGSSPFDSRIRSGCKGVEETHKTGTEIVNISVGAEEIADKEWNCLQEKVGYCFLDSEGRERFPMAYRRLSCELDSVRALQPFGHQVGGHASMLKIGDNKICKPFSEKERDFYECLGKHMEGLKEFVPCYLGTIDVVVDALGIPAEAKGVLPEIPVQCVRFHDERCEARMTRQSLPKKKAKEKANKENALHDNEPKKYQSAEEGTVSPWGLRCFENFRRKLEEKGHSEVNHYILIEDLTFNFTYPCVLDLKMGVRHYADGASQEKIRSQSAKSANTTSSTLGVRICGMQVYNVATREYEYQDKYVGRTHTQQTFKNGILQFLENGESKRYDIVPLLLSKLTKLRNCMEKANGYRFFSSSLLVIYEGCVKDDQGAPLNEASSDLHVDIRMIDFANTALPPKCCGEKHLADPTQTYTGPDTGYLFGLDSLIHIFTDIAESTSL